MSTNFNPKYKLTDEDHAILMAIRFNGIVEGRQIMVPPYHRYYLDDRDVTEVIGHLYLSHCIRIMYPIPYTDPPIYVAEDEVARRSEGETK